MCGIAGFIDPETAAPERESAVQQMCAAMVHRGPDDSGCVSRGAATIGMRRLAIFDPAGGHQPMATPDGRFHIVFNGAVYNFRELQRELEAAGHSFRTRCDTEVLLAAYAHWRDECVDRLRGMYAFAVWDAHDERLFLARDPFGIKPLYYRVDDGRLLFASELNALRSAGLVSTAIDPQAVAEYLGWFAVPAPRTIYQGVMCLRAGECATFHHGRLDVRPAWGFRSIRPSAACRTPAEFDEVLQTQLRDTIRAHMIADVPVGAFLSGGIDSAAIVGLMTEATGARLKTFTIGFEEADHDESVIAERVARHFGTTHHTHVLTGRQVAADLPHLLAAFDQPSGDGVNTYYVSQAARAGGVTVALSGLGGDELFGGYPSFRDVPRLRRWLSVWRRTPAALRRSVLQRLRRRDTRHRKLADILEHATNRAEICAMQRRVFTLDRQREFLSPEVREGLDAESLFHPGLERLADDLARTGTFAAISAWELSTYMTDVLLRDSDVMSMRHSLELRVPFVDRVFVEWLWSQPSHFKERLPPKAALAHALRRQFPPGFGQHEKRGFMLPFGQWTRGELRPFLEETFSSSSLARSGLFHAPAVQAFWRDYLAGSDVRQWSRVWSLAVLVDFVNRRAPHGRASQPGSGRVLVVEPRSERPSPAVDRATKRSAHHTLLMAPEIFESEGGITRILQLYLKALCDFAGPGDSVRLLSLNDTVLDSRDLRRSSNQRLTRWHVCSAQKPQFVAAALQLSRGCDRLVCGHVAQLPVALLAKSLNPRLRYYLVAHGIEVWRRFTPAEKVALRLAERIFCVSDYTRREMLRFCRVDPQRAVVLPNALHPRFEIAPGLSRNGEPPVILLISRITQSDRYKGLEHLLQAMPAIRAAVPGTTLRVIGRGDDLGTMVAMRDELGLGRSVEFLGYVSDERVADEMRRCSLFALPSAREGFGLVFLEAMARGRPCIGARAGGIPEVITDETGLLVEYGDVPGLANACITALRRDWDEHAILERARAFAYPVFKDRLAMLLET